MSGHLYRSPQLKRAAASDEMRPKRKVASRPFAVECRTKPGTKWGPAFVRDWFVWRRYGTEKAADEAVKTLNKNCHIYEYRRKA